MVHAQFSQSLNFNFLIYLAQQVALSLRNFTGPHCIVPMYVVMILLRNTKSQKIIA